MLIDQTGANVDVRTIVFDAEKAAGHQGAAMLPRLPVSFGQFAADASSYLMTLENALGGVAKALTPPPQAFSYTNVNYMPDISQSGLLPWPKLDPGTLRKIATENIVPRMIINQRQSDIARYATHSAYPWRPGWRIELMDTGKHPSASEMRDIRDAERYIHNCNRESAYSDARERDAAHLAPFADFLKAAVNDSETYDGWAIYTDMDRAGRIKSFANLPAGNIRLAHPRNGFKGDPTKFAALVDDTGNPITSFTRDEMTWRVRNPRTDASIFGYGWPEIEQATTLIGAFQDAIDLNAATFNKSAIPNGIILLMGDFWNADQIDLLTRAQQNMKMGVSKAWGIPVMGVPEGGDVKVLPMNDLKGYDVRYKDHMNMVAGISCVVWQFPVTRFGFFTSGHTQDSQPLPDESVEIQGVDDPGLPARLLFIQDTINQYLLWPNWPHLRFSFQRIDPKTDNREYEARKLARTWKESRAEADLPSLTKILPTEHKEFAELMEACPEDPNKASVYATLVSVYLSAKNEPESEGDGVKKPKVKGSIMQSKKDPAKSAEHGHMAGVRRDSAHEEKISES